MFDDGIHWLQSWLRRPQNGKGFNSIGDLEIPEPVLEELLQNALIHLDLLKPAAIRLLIFDNRIEIINPGCLPGNQTVDDIRRGNSNPRNIQLARFCLKTLPYRGLGSGIPRAFSLDKNIELVNSQSGNQFTAIIRRMPDDDCVSHHSGQNVPQSGQNVPQSGQNVPQSGQNVPQSGQNVPQSGQNVPQSGQNVPQSGQNVPQSGQNVPQSGQNVPQSGQNVPQSGQNVPQSGQNVSKEIGDIISNVPEKENIIARWNAILVCLTKDNSLSKEDIAKKLKVSPKTIQRDIAAMNDYIHVAWIGSMKNGHWEISAK